MHVWENLGESANTKNKVNKWIVHSQFNSHRTKRATAQQHWYRFRWIKALMTTHAAAAAASRALNQVEQNMEQRWIQKRKWKKLHGILVRYRCSKNMHSICNNYIEYVEFSMNMKDGYRWTSKIPGNQFQMEMHFILHLRHECTINSIINDVKSAHTHARIAVCVFGMSILISFGLDFLLWIFVAQITHTQSIFTCVAYWMQIAHYLRRNQMYFT